MKTDKAVYEKSSLPTLPPSGGSYTDSIFGATVMRVTDETDYPGPGCGTWYNQFPTFNCNNTLLLIRCGVNGDMLIKQFDPVNFKLGGVVRRTPYLPGGVTLEWQGATWSATDPDLIYVHVNNYGPDYPATGMKLYTYRVSTERFELLKDFAPELSPGQPDYLFEMHSDAKNDVFTFMHKRVGMGSEPIAFIVWSRAQDKVLAHVKNDFDVNACLIDKSGRYAVFTTNKNSPGEVRQKVLDLQTGAWEVLLWDAHDRPSIHGDVGTGVMVGRDSWSGGFNFRRLDAPKEVKQLFDFKDSKGQTDWTDDSHATLYADDERWALLATMDDPHATVGETHAFEDEILQIATDGSGSVRRLLHHRSKWTADGNEITGYWGTPKPTVSRDGRYVAYTSNWEGTSRYDLFIAKIEAATAPTPEPGPTPTTTNPTPTTPPQPSAPPQYEWQEKAWPSSKPARIALLNQMGADGWQPWTAPGTGTTVLYFYRAKR